MPEPSRSPTPPPAAFAIGDIYYILFRHKWKILIGFVLGLLASAGVYLTTPAVYLSEAALMVRYVSDSTILEQLTTGERVTSPGRGGENVMNTEITILSSRELVEKALNAMDASQFGSEPSNRVNRALLAENILHALRIEVPKNSNIIRVTFGNPNPGTAQEFLRRLTELYLLKHVELHRGSGTYDFLREQTDQLRAQLKETEEELSKIKHDEGIVSIEDSKKNIADRSQELARSIDELEATLAASRARASMLQGIVITTFALSNAPGAVAVMSTATNLERIAELRSRLTGLQKRESDLLTSYTPDSIPVTNIRKQIEEVQSLIKGEAPATTAPSTNSLPASSLVAATNTTPELRDEQANCAALQARIAYQKESLQRVLAEARKVDAVENRIVQLQRNQELQDKKYRYYYESLERARVDEALNSGKITNINIVQPATLPAGKTRLNLPKKMAMAFFLGLGLALGLALAQEFVLDTTIRRAGELAAVFQTSFVMTLPILARPPRRARPLPVARRLSPLGKNGTPRRTRAKSSAPPAAGAAPKADVAADSIQSAETQRFPELFESVRDHFLLQISANHVQLPYVLGITSCASGAGCSTLANELAVGLARESGIQTVLVDASTEAVAPTCYVVQGNGKFELLDVLGQAAAAEKAAAEKGQPPKGPTMLAENATLPHPKPDTDHPTTKLTALMLTASGGVLDCTGRNQIIASIINSLREKTYPFVIVDLPPVTETGLTRRVAWLHNGLLMVVPSEKISRSVAGIVQRWLSTSEAHVFGCILNKRRKYVPDWLCQKL